MKSFTHSLVRNSIIYCVNPETISKPKALFDNCISSTLNMMLDLSLVNDTEAGVAKYVLENNGGHLLWLVVIH